MTPFNYLLSHAGSFDMSSLAALSAVSLSIFWGHHHKVNHALEHFIVALETTVRV